MNEFNVWMRATELSTWVRDAPWTWPALETLHFIGMCLMIGVIGLLDFRLLGYLQNIPVKALRSLLPWGILGFAINLVSGVLFFVGAPDQYMRNLAFYFKLLFLIVAGLNALYFETTQGGTHLAIGASGPPSTGFKVAGAVSLFSWLMVLYWGRMLPFIGNAF